MKKFDKILKENHVDYELVNGIYKINGGDVVLNSLTILPDNVQFNNGEDVVLSSLTTLPDNVQFNNGRDVFLSSLTTLTDNVQFNNGGNVVLSSLTTLTDNVQFNNGGNVDLSSLTTLTDNVQFNNGGNVDLSSLTTLPDNVQFNNGGNVDLSSLTTLPDNVQFNNGGNVVLSSLKISIKTPYLKRFNVAVTNGKCVLYKRVSKDWKTQAGTDNETLWEPGGILAHSNWNPTNEECGSGKFHACARPGWCDMFRTDVGDRYIAIRIRVEDLSEWTKSPLYPCKIAFRAGYVIGECDRNGNLL